jgi:hypothetical protein
MGAASRGGIPEMHRHHGVADGGEILIDRPITVVVPTVQHVLVDQAVTVIIGPVGKTAVAARRTFGHDAVELVPIATAAGILARNQFGL